MTGRSVPARVVALLIVLPVLLTSAVTYAAHRDRSALPDAIARVWEANLLLDSYMVCIQGVQDDVFAAGVRTPPSARKRAAALPRLAGCGLTDLQRAARVHLPPTPPLQAADLQRIRASVQDAIDLLQRISLDAATTQHATETFLRTGGSADVVAIGYRSLELASGRLEALLRVAGCTSAGAAPAMRVALGCPAGDRQER